MKQTPHQTLHQELLQLRGRAKAWLEGEEPEGFHPDLGACSNLQLNPHCLALLGVLLAVWPGGSGDDLFPVPHPTKSPIDAFFMCDALEMWHPRYEYARNRWALLEWLIEQTAPTIQLGEKS